MRLLQAVLYVLLSDVSYDDLQNPRPLEHLLQD